VRLLAVLPLQLRAWHTGFSVWYLRVPASSLIETIVGVVGVVVGAGFKNLKIEICVQYLRTD